MSGFGFSDGDDVIIKGDDGTEEGQKIVAKQDGSDYRLGVDGKLRGDTDNALIGNVGDSIKVFQSNEATINVGTQNTDLFDRLAIAEDTPLWSYAHRYDTDQDLYWDISASNGGTCDINLDTVVAEIKNSTGNGDTVTYRTFRYFEYSKGRQQTYMFTCNPRGNVSGVKKEFGAFDDANGLFFRLDGTNASIVIRSSTSGSVVETVVAQSSFNTDKADGTTVSGVDMGNWDKYNLFYIQFAWLGGNAVEFGIFDGGKRKPFHRFAFANQSTTSYSQSGHLPINVNIENTSAQGSQPQIDLNCMAVFNNGRQNNFGEVISVDTGATEVTVNTTTVVLASIRMQANKNRASIKPVGFDLLSPSGNSTIYYQVVIGGTFTGDVWSPINSSIAEGLSSYTTFTGGQVIQSGYVQAGGNREIQEILSDLYLGRFINGSSQPLSLLVRTISSNAKLLFSGRFREYK